MAPLWLNGFMFTGYFRISLYCPPLNCTVYVCDWFNYWVDRIKWLGYAINASELVSCIQVSITIAANLIANYALTGHGSLLASQSDRE